MNKRQEFLLLGMLLANFWGFVLYAPSIGQQSSLGSSRPTSPSASSVTSQRSFRSNSNGSAENQQNSSPVSRPTSPSASSASSDYADNSDSQSASAVDVGSGADNAAYQWVRENGLKIARKLYDQGTMDVSIANVAAAYSSMNNGAKLDDLEFYDQETKVYIEGNINGMVQEMAHMNIARQSGDQPSSGTPSNKPAGQNKVAGVLNLIQQVAAKKRTKNVAREHKVKEVLDLIHQVRMVK